jgi:hypothetical protein
MFPDTFQPAKDAFPNHVQMSMLKCEDESFTHYVDISLSHSSFIFPRILAHQGLIVCLDPLEQFQGHDREDRSKFYELVVA